MNARPHHHHHLVRTAAPPLFTVEYVLLEITQEREDDKPGEDPKRYKCLDMDVAQPQVPPPKVTLPLERLTKNLTSQNANSAS